MLHLNKESGEKFPLPSIYRSSTIRQGREHNYDNYSMKIMLLGFLYCSMSVNVSLISLNMEVVGF